MRGVHLTLNPLVRSFRAPSAEVEHKSAENQITPTGTAYTLSAKARIAGAAWASSGIVMRCQITISATWSLRWRRGIVERTPASAAVFRSMAAHAERLGGDCAIAFPGGVLQFKKRDR